MKRVLLLASLLVSVFAASAFAVPFQHEDYMGALMDPNGQTDLARQGFLGFHEKWEGSINGYQAFIPLAWWMRNPMHSQLFESVHVARDGRHWDFEEIQKRGQGNNHSSAPSPVPEPGTLLLLSSGLVGVGFLRWRKLT